MQERKPSRVTVCGVQVSVNDDANSMGPSASM